MAFIMPVIMSTNLNRKLLLFLCLVGTLASFRMAIKAMILKVSSWLLNESANPWTYAYVIIVSIFSYLFNWLFISPLNRVRHSDDVGYFAEGNMTKKQMANLVRRRRTKGDLPPVYPNGWFVVVESKELAKRQSRSVHILGMNLAVFRDEYGRAHVVDAYCPHLGANLGVGGRVSGDCIECPFHGWRFRGEDGKCTHIPTTDKIPDLARVKSWPTYEVNGFVHIWFHAEKRDPWWWPEELEEIATGDLTYRGRTEHHVNSHIEDVPENGADTAHLTQVHGPTVVVGTDIRHTYSKLGQIAKHDWTATWRPLPEPQNHMAVVNLTHALSMWGYHIPIADVHVKAKQVGPAIVYLRFTGTFGRFALLQVITPSEPMEQRLIHHIYAAWNIPTVLAKIYLTLEAIQVERDIMVWNHKTYNKKPLLVKSNEDTMIGKYRRWYQQFYSENSPRLTFRKDSMDF